MSSYHTKFVVRTAVLLALCVAVQQFKSVSQFITGPLVNLILILAVLAVGLWGGVAIAVLSPLMAALISPAPVMKLVPQMVPLIMVGNLVLVVCIHLLREKKLWMGLALGTLLKPAALALGVQLVVLPFFGTALNDMQRAMVTAMFSYNQVITAAIASVICLLVWPRLHKVPGFALQKA